jgi:hypothetical protein
MPQGFLADDEIFLKGRKFGCVGKFRGRALRRSQSGEAAEFAIQARPCNLALSLSLCSRSNKIRIRLGSDFPAVLNVLESLARERAGRPHGLEVSTHRPRIGVVGHRRSLHGVCSQYNLTATIATASYIKSANQARMPMAMQGVTCDLGGLACYACCQGLPVIVILQQPLRPLAPSNKADPEQVIHVAYHNALKRIILLSWESAK